MGKRAAEHEQFRVIKICRLLLVDEHFVTTDVGEFGVCSPPRMGGTGRRVGGESRPGSLGASQEGGQTANSSKICGADHAGSAQGCELVECYAATFFVDFDADLVVGFLVVFAFSFAANSCLTVAEMASTSTW